MEERDRIEWSDLGKRKERQRRGITFWAEVGRGEGVGHGGGGRKRKKKKKKRTESR